MRVGEHRIVPYSCVSRITNFLRGAPTRLLTSSLSSLMSFPTWTIPTPNSLNVEIGQLLLDPVHYLYAIPFEHRLPHMKLLEIFCITLKLQMTNDRQRARGE